MQIKCVSVLVVFFSCTFKRTLSQYRFCLPASLFPHDSHVDSPLVQVCRLSALLYFFVWAEEWACVMCYILNEPNSVLCVCFEHLFHFMSYAWVWILCAYRMHISNLMVWIIVEWSRFEAHNAPRTHHTDRVWKQFPFHSFDWHRLGESPSMLNEPF